MAQVAAAGAAVPVAVPAGNPTPLQTVLDWIGFNQAAVRNALEAELTDLESMKGLTYKDVRDLRDSFASRTRNEGKIYFGINRTKRLQSLIDYVQDQERINKPIDITTYANAAEFVEALNVSKERAEVRANDEESMEARAKEASPGKLTGEQVWDKWEQLLVNMLSILIGVQGVPLLYVIREVEDPPEDAVYDNFTEMCIARCPLTGPKFEADARKVHQIIVSYCTGENAEQWIKSRRHNGREDMKALRDHYQGEGNQTRRIGDAERMRDSLHYKSEAAMPFSTFLSKCQKMFNLFEQTNEAYVEAAKIRFLFDKISNTELRPAVESLRAQISVAADSHTFASASNHLAALVKPRNARALSAVATAELPPEIVKNGKINTGYYGNWNSLSPECKQLVTAERERLGISKSNKNGGGKGRGNDTKKIKKLKRQVSKLRSKVATIKKSQKESDDDEDGSSEEDDNGNAGDQFGGRNEKEKRKPKKRKKDKH